MNENLSFSIEVGKLGDFGYYESCLDQLQAGCSAAGVLPCVFDAAAFNDENKKAPDQDRLASNTTREAKGTTSIGHLNKNGQVCSLGLGKAVL